MMARAPATRAATTPRAPAARHAAPRAAHAAPPRAAGTSEIGELITELYETAAAVRERGEHVARSVGQTQSRWQVLFTLASGPLAVPAMARRLGLTRQSVQRIVTLLVADGLAASLPNPVHRRSPLFELTPAGSRTLGKINAAARDWHGAVSAALGPADQERLRSMLAALRRRARQGDTAGTQTGPGPRRARARATVPARRPAGSAGPR